MPSPYSHYSLLHRRTHDVLLVTVRQSRAFGSGGVSWRLRTIRPDDKIGLSHQKGAHPPDSVGKARFVFCQIH